MKARSWEKPEHMKPQSTEAKANANRKRAARRKAQSLVQATTTPKWHAAPRRHADKRETLSWEEQASDKAKEQAAERAKRPRTTRRFPNAPWAGTASSSGSVGPRPPVFGPPAYPPPGRERTRSPEGLMEHEDEQSFQFSSIGCRRLIGWNAEHERLVRELENVETQEDIDEIDRKISALTAQLDEDDERYAPGAEQARIRIYEAKRAERLERQERFDRETIEISGDEEGEAT